MNRIYKIAILLSLIICLCVGSGCVNAPQGAAGGSLIGAGAGAIIGGLFGNAAAGAAIGAVAGGLGGAVIGAENQRRLMEANQDKFAKLPVTWKTQPGHFEIVGASLHYCVGADYLIWSPARNKFVSRDWPALEAQARQLGVSIDNLPNDWQPDGQTPASFGQKPDGTICYNFGNDHLVWKKWGNWETED